VFLPMCLLRMHCHNKPLIFLKKIPINTHHTPTISTAITQFIGLRKPKNT
jgi:hypothetical protein